VKSSIEFNEFYQHIFFKSTYTLYNYELILRTEQKIDVPQKNQGNLFL